MRKEAFSVNDFIHVYNRGNRKQLIVHDGKDRWRFLQMLYYFNTEISVSNPMQDVRKKLKPDFNLIWPNDWPERKPIVRILAFSLMQNHFHLLLKEITSGGVTMFMRKLGTGMTNYFNTKYNETGRLFQGAYKAKRIDNDEYLKYVSVYIQAKNPFELYPGGLDVAVSNIEGAMKWAAQYPYCSLGDYINDRNSPIIEKDLLGEIFKTPLEYKEFAQDSMINLNLDERVQDFVFDED